MASSDKPRPIHEIRQEAFLLSSTPPPPLNISPFEGVQNPIKGVNCMCTSMCICMYMYALILYSVLQFL